MKNIFRSTHETNFTVISNETLSTPKLSLAAKGLLAYLLSLPDDWKINMSELSEHFKDTEGKIRKAIKELTEEGYVDSWMMRKGNRSIGFRYVVYEDLELHRITHGKVELFNFEDVQTEHVENEHVEIEDVQTENVQSEDLQNPVTYKVLSNNKKINSTKNTSDQKNMREKYKKHLLEKTAKLKKLLVDQDKLIDNLIATYLEKFKFLQNPEKKVNSTIKGMIELLKDFKDKQLFLAALKRTIEKDPEYPLPYFKQVLIGKFKTKSNKPKQTGLFTNEQNKPGNTQTGYSNLSKYRR